VPVVVFSPRAEEQMVEALAFTFERFGEHKYLEYLALIRFAIESLEKDSAAGRPRPEIHPDAWTLHIARGTKRARHLLLYRVREAVEVGAFLYDAMDLPRQRPADWDEP
jgi:plasmid stabilization system protein ParE